MWVGPFLNPDYLPLSYGQYLLSSLPLPIPDREPNPEQYIFTVTKA